MSNFTNKSSNYFVTIFIGFIILSFMFTGYQSMQSSPDAVATVGSKKVSVTEYRQEYQRQLKFYKGIFGGKDLTAKQIEQFGVKSNTLKNLIQRKLLLTFSENVGIHPSSAEIKAEIKNLPYFKTNDQFDINRYKSLLAANRLSPVEFEKDIMVQVKGRKASALLQNYPISTTYTQELLKFKNNKFSMDFVTINKEALRKFINISNSEIKTYLKDKTNLDRVTSLFNERKLSLSTPEQVEASHILLKTDGKNDKAIEKKIKDLHKKLTTSNFSKMANKYTEDPSGKKKGGSLGKFSKGRMVPPFEKIAFTIKPGVISSPVKTNFGYHIILVKKRHAAVQANLAAHQDTFAKELIAKSKNSEIEALLKLVSSKVKTALEASDIKTIEKLRAKYLFVWQQKIEINQLDGAKGQSISDDNFGKLAKAVNGQTLVFSEVTQTQLVKKSAFTPKKDAKNQTAKELQTTLAADLSKSFSAAIIKQIESSVTIKTQNKLL